MNEGSVQAPKYASCCLLVEGVERNVFFLPRPFRLERDGTQTDVSISFDEVHAEVQAKLKSMGITKKKVKPVKRKYMFGFIDPHVPPEAFYYKVSYPFLWMHWPLTLLAPLIPEFLALLPALSSCFS